jgi:signal transduction histidine kinase
MRLIKLWNWFWKYAVGVSIRIKIIGIVVVIIMIFCAAITFQLRNNLTTTLYEQLENQGMAIARDLAARSTDLILTNNSFDLYQLVQDTVENNENVRYSIILSPKGDILGHSFKEGIPVGLVEINQIPANVMFQLERLDSHEGLIIDIATPIFGGRSGTARVGMTTIPLQQTIAETTGYWFIIAGLVSIIGLTATYFLTSVLIKPVHDLVEATKAITKGDLKHKAPIWAPDEIGKLAMAFNEMTEYLANARDQLEAVHAEIVKRNLELSALNVIADELSRAGELSDMMDRSLSKVLGFMKLDAGWISIQTGEQNRTNVICHKGLSPEIVHKLDNANLLACACGAAVLKKMPVVIDSTEGNCPILDNRLSNGQHLLLHAAIPLIAKSQVSGILHIASSQLNQFTTDQINLLSAIGHQMGVAIENYRLWEELKRKQEVRGHLLEEIISAQEAERKRIARELHDQTGQSLTSLLIGLKALESDGHRDFHKQISSLRQLTAQTLEEIHNLALELRPNSLDDLGLITTLDQYTREYTDKFFIDAEFQAIGINESLISPEIKITVYRIIQEALTNVMKHSEAKRVSVVLEARGSSVIAIVEDDGNGFDIKKESVFTNDERKLGLHGMYERATLIGGILTIESKPGMGTTVFVEVPLKTV